jgi:hypothetical protein
MDAMQASTIPGITLRDWMLVKMDLNDAVSESRKVRAPDEIARIAYWLAKSVAEIKQACKQAKVKNISGMTGTKPVLALKLMLRKLPAQPSFPPRDAEAAPKRKKAETPAGQGSSKVAKTQATVAQTMTSAEWTRAADQKRMLSMNWAITQSSCADAFALRFADGDVKLGHEAVLSAKPRKLVGRTFKAAPSWQEHHVRNSATAVEISVDNEGCQECGGDENYRIVLQERGPELRIRGEGHNRCQCGSGSLEDVDWLGSFTAVPA